MSGKLYVEKYIFAARIENLTELFNRPKTKIREADDS